MSGADLEEQHQTRGQESYSQVSCLLAPIRRFSLFSRPQSSP